MRLRDVGCKDALLSANARRSSHQSIEIRGSTWLEPGFRLACGSEWYLRFGPSATWSASQSVPVSAIVGKVHRPTLTAPDERPRRVGRVTALPSRAAGSSGRAGSTGESPRRLHRWRISAAPRARRLRGDSTSERNETVMHFHLYRCHSDASDPLPATDGERWGDAPSAGTSFAQVPDEEAQPFRAPKSDGTPLDAARGVPARVLSAQRRVQRTLITDPAPPT